MPIPGVLKRILYVRVLLLADTVKTVPLLLGYVLGGDNGGVALLVITWGEIVCHYRNLIPSYCWNIQHQVSSSPVGGRVCR